jgi:hypothetical protein
MRRLWSHGDELEARLRASRPEPRREFLDAIVGQFEPKRTGGVLRVAFAAGLTVVGLVMLGAFGGIGYASSAAHSLVSSVTSSDGPKGKGGGGDHGKAAANRGNSANVSAAADQYVGKTTICHHTHSQTNPWVVITVSNNALPAHKAHGDTLVGPGGTCPGPPIP